MNKKLTWLAIAAATMGMGINLPSCPGQQAMQQQIDALQASNTDLQKRLQAMSADLGGMKNDVTQLKQAVPQLASEMQTQRTRIDQTEGVIKELQTKMAQKMAAPPAGKKKGR